jgi:hypothetical protein
MFVASHCCAFDHSIQHCPTVLIVQYQFCCSNFDDNNYRKSNGASQLQQIIVTQADYVTICPHLLLSFLRTNTNILTSQNFANIPGHSSARAIFNNWQSLGKCKFTAWPFKCLQNQTTNSNAKHQSFIFVHL